MVPGIEDLLPPPPKKGTKQVEGELLPPPPKKKMEDGTGTSGEIGGTVGASKAQSNIPVSKTTVTEEFTENLLDPATSIKKQKDANTVFTQSQVLGDIEIADEAIPANIIDKAGYRTSLQQRINSKIPEQIDLEVIATSTNKPIEAVEAYTKGRDGKGVMIEFDTVKKNKATELNNLITKANADLGLSDDFDAVFTSPETASLYLNKIQTAYNQKTEREFNSLNEVVINGKKRILEQDDEAYIDKSLPASKLRYYNPIKNRNDQVLNVLKSTIGEDILTKIENDENLTYDQKVKKAGDLVFGNELKNISEAEGKRFVKDSFGALNIVNQFGKLFRNEDEETKNLNSINAIVETKLNSEIQKEIVYKQAAMADILQLAMEKANAGTLTEEDKVTYQEMVTQLKDDIAAKQKDYKSPQVLQKEYPILLKQSVIADINNFNAIQSGNVVGYEEGGYKGISLKEHLKAQGYDMNSQVVKDAISDAESGVGVKDYSFFGEPIKAIKEVFTSSAKSLGNIIGVRDDVTVLSEKKAGELFPTTVGENDEMQLTTAASTAQNIFNTTGQVIGQGLMQVGTAGLGRLAGLSKVAAANTGFWSSGALTSYDAAYKDSFDFIDSNVGRTAYAGLIALSNAASEKIFPESKLFNIPGVKSAYSELASKMGTEGFTDKLATQLLTKAKNEFLDYGKKYATNIGKETLEETATSLFESGSRMLFGDPNMNVGKAIEDAKNTAIQTAIGTVLIGGMGVHKDVQQERNIAPSSVIYNAAVYKDEAMDALNIGFKQGNYDQQELNSKISLLNTAEVGLSELKKAEQVIGRELTRPQKELFVANSTAQKLLIEQKKGVEDEAVIKKIDEKLKNLNSQQTQLLDNKVQIDEFGNVIVPVKETKKETVTVTEETTDEKIKRLETELESITDDNNPRIAEIDAELTALEKSTNKVELTAEEQAAVEGFKGIDFGTGSITNWTNIVQSETATPEEKKQALKELGEQLADKRSEVEIGEALGKAVDFVYAVNDANGVKTDEGLAVPVTEQTEAAPEVKPPTNKKEKLAAFKKNYVEQAQPTATEQKQWNELSMAEKLALAKNNLPEVDNLTNTEAVKVADQNAKMLLAKLNQQPEVATTEDVPPPTEQSGKDVVETGVGKPVTGVAYHGISSKEGKSKGIYLADETSAQNFGDGEVQQYNYTLNKPLVVEKDSDFDVVNKIISDYTKQNPGAKFHPNITDHVNKELEKLGYDGLIIKEQALETEKGYNEIGGTYGEPQIVVFDRKNVSKVEKLKPEIKNEEANNIGNENINKNEPIIADDPAENKIAVAKLTEEDNIEQEPNVKAIGQQAEVAAGIGSKEIEVARDQANELINAAIEVVNVPISEIKTNEQEYQGRKNKFSERSANNVAENFDKNKLQPIVVYKHPDGNTYVLSGHSRLEGMKRRKATTIPATYFEGTPQEAIDFSLKSNKLGTLQTDIENAAYYRKKLLAGESYNAVLKEAKENEQEGSAKRIVSIAHLNPNGKAMQALEALDKGEGDTKNNILNIATKIGDIRAKNDHLTNAHENELFEFMAADKKNIPTDKDLANSNNVLNRSLNQAKFTPEEPLNLDRAVNKSANRIEWERELKELEAQQTELKLAVNPSKKTGWTGLKEKAIATLAKGDNSKEGIEKASLAFENNENGIKDAYQKQLETKRAELASVNDKLAKHLLREKDLIQGDKAQQSLFSIQSPTTQEISDMKDIVKDYVDEGTVSLQDIQNDVAKELGDNSEEMRDLVEKAYNEFTKTTDFAPKEITGDVIGKVGKFLSRLFGGTAASKVFIFKDEKSLLAKASELHGYKIMSSPSGVVLGFAHQGKIYLNAEHINTNSIIHESGHIWTEWVKQNHPEVYTRGMQLVENSQYLKQVRSDEHYKTIASTLGSEGSKEYSDYMKHEALAMAIGDKGAQFVGETRKKDFKEWLNNLWNIIKAAAGFKDITASELQNLTFDEFTKRAAADILRDEEVTQPQGQQQKGTGTAPAAAQPKAKTKLTDVEVGVIREVLDKPIDAKEFPTFFDMNAQGKQQTAVTQEAGQDRMALDGTYVKAHLEDLRSISLNNARVLQDALGKDWKEKLIGFLEDNPTAGNIAQVSGLLNVINTDIYNEIAKSKSGTEISKLKDLQARADRITYDTARSASLALNQRRMYQDFGQGKDVADILSAVILTPEQQAMKSKVEEALKQKFTDEELNKPKPVKPKKAAQPKTTKTAKPKTDDSVKKDLISKGKKAAQQTDADGNVTIVSLKDKIQQANDALNGFKC